MERIENRADAVKPNLVVIAIAIVSLVVIAVVKNLL